VCRYVHIYAGTHRNLWLWIPPELDQRVVSNWTQINKINKSLKKKTSENDQKERQCRIRCQGAVSHLSRSVVVSPGFFSIPFSFTWLIAYCTSCLCLVGFFLSFFLKKKHIKRVLI
jgi:predicted Co/Zn/Cd cation transporter (cation efflux family)